MTCMLCRSGPGICLGCHLLTCVSIWTRHMFWMSPTYLHMLPMRSSYTGLSPAICEKYVSPPFSPTAPPAPAVIGSKLHHHYRQMLRCSVWLAATGAWDVALVGLPIDPDPAAYNGVHLQTGQSSVHSLEHTGFGSRASPSKCHVPFVRQHTSTL